MSKKIGIIGHFGGGKNLFDGQTVKTKILYQELSSRGFDNIFKVDTYYNKTNKAKLLVQTLKCFFKCDTVIALLSVNGLKIYLPLLYMAKKIFKIKVYHDVIGGRLATYVEENPEYAKYLSSFDSNWVEFSKMAKDLAKMGVTNCDVVPNFKKLDTKDALEVPSDEGKHSFCMFSRVVKDKGMTAAIEAVARYNNEHSQKVKLNIWGALDEGYKEEFENLLNEHGDYVFYKGKVDFDKSVKTITDHIALLFPTYWKSEGFPGTVIDAYSSALPVIASNTWDACTDLVRNFETGWVYPNDKVDSLYESICYAMEHTDEMIAMRKNCSLFVTRYSPDFVMRRIIEKYLK